MHKLIKSEKFKNKKGKECIRNFYGTNEDNISCEEIIEPAEENFTEPKKEYKPQHEINVEILEKLDLILKLLGKGEGK